MFFLAFIKSYAINELTISEKDLRILQNYTILNETGDLMNNIDFLVYGPVLSNSFQECVEISAKMDFVVYNDFLNNQILKFSIDELPPYSQKKIQIEYRLIMRANVIKNEIDLNKYLQTEKYIEVENDKIRILAKSLLKKSKLETIEAIFYWITNNIKYKKYNKVSKGALSTFLKKEGDCTEFMYLFIALCRANNIPSRAVAGYYCENSSVLNPYNYHNWAEVFFENRWRIVDPQQNSFMKNENKYIVFKNIKNNNKKSDNDFERYKLDVKGIKVFMNY